MKTIKRIFLTRTKWVLSISAMIAIASLICYAAFAQMRHGDAPRDDNDAAVSSAAQNPNSLPEAFDNESNPDFVKRRREWMDRFFGLGSVPPAAHARALAAARELPLSPLLGGGRFAPVTPSVQGWTQPIPPPILNNPNSSDATTRIQALGLHPTNNNIVYTGSFGGLARSTDAGVTWRYLSDAWNSQAVTCVEVNPSNPSYVYVGTGMERLPGPPVFAFGLYRSSDAGASWTNIGATEFGGTLVRAVTTDPNTSSTVYVANARSHSSQYPPGVWRSTNSGAFGSWALKHRAGDPNSSKEWNGIYDIAVDRSQPSTVYIADDDGIWKSSNYGDDWTFIPGFPAGGDVTRLSVVNSAIYVLAGSGANRRLYKSTDGGATWVQIPTPGLAVFAVDPANPQIIMGGSVDWYRTQNEGVTWTQLPTSVHVDHRIIAFSPNNSGIVYDGNDGGIVRSTDHGQTWANLNHNFPGAWLYGVALSQDGTMIAGTQDCGVVFSNVAGGVFPPWDSIRSGDSAHNLIDPISGGVGYTTLYWPVSFERFNRANPHQVVIITPDQFSSDCACNFFPTFSMNSMNPTSPTHIIAACQRVVRTLSGPTVTHDTWTQIGSGPLPSPSPCAAGVVVTAASEAPSNSNVIYAVTNYDTVYVTTNADLGTGATWYRRTNQNQPGGIHAVTVDPTNHQIAYLACDSDVYKTTDTGSSWNRTGSTDDLIYRDVAINPANPQRVFAACNAGVLASMNGGGIWANMSAGSIPAGMVISALSFNGPSLQLAAATIGRGVYLINLDDVPPTVAITSPLYGATVSGTVPVTATASDNVGVLGVQFKLDGWPLGQEDTSPPYSISWNTATTPNGTHTLTAVARDAAGNSTTSAPIKVKVSN